ncbi:MAG: hypothetical protein K6E63_09545 [Lachnospiraceae bacterium]|nr:hypothetical protein [Lachnospiraceae bacterium]
MRKCLNCNIKIGGHADSCPLCQNSLTGDATADNWPSPSRLRAQAFLYKLQLFLVLATIAVGISLDYLLGLNNGTHYSLVIALWLIVFEFDLSANIKRLLVISRTVSISTLHICLLLLLTGWYFGFMDIAAYMIIPILLGAALLTNLVFAMTDTTENALVYLLGNIFLVIVIYAVLMAKRIDTGLVWTICLMVSFVSLIGIIIFKGRKVSNEIRKRMNF